MHRPVAGGVQLANLCKPLEMTEVGWIALLFSVGVSATSVPLEISNCRIREDLCVGDRVGIECDMTNTGVVPLAAVRFRSVTTAEPKNAYSLPGVAGSKNYEELNPALWPGKAQSHVMVFKGPGEEFLMETLSIRLDQLEALDYYRDVVKGSQTYRYVIPNAD